MSFRIEKLWVFVAVGDDDEEGLIAMHTPRGWVPFVAADERRIEDLRERAEGIAREHGQVVKLVRFGTRVDLETIDPGSRPGSS